MATKNESQKIADLQGYYPTKTITRVTDHLITKNDDGSDGPIEMGYIYFDDGTKEPNTAPTPVSQEFLDQEAAELARLRAENRDYEARLQAEADEYARLHPPVGGPELDEDEDDVFGDPEARFVIDDNGERN